MVDKIPPSRCVRKDIYDLEGDFQRYKREFLDHEAYQEGLSGIHIDAVTDAMNNYSINAILGVRSHSLQLKNVGGLDKPG